jgi:hypothetical protein
MPDAPHARARRRILSFSRARKTLVPTTRTLSGRMSRKSLAEALEARQRPRRHVLVQPAVGFEAGAEPDHFRRRSRMTSWPCV